MLLFLILLFLGWVPTLLFAQITLDGTLAKNTPLIGPHYQISADLGREHGGNLFHSFRDFTLQSHESATFSGSSQVHNIISRVTGGNPSSIDGTLRSTIPGAHLYFFNPAGIIFGPNVQLDIQGSFYASTADTLQLQDGGQFQARVPNDSFLTIAPPKAFGFLTNSPATLHLQGSQLTVPTGQTLSLTGGDIVLNNAQLQVPSGQVILASLTQAGQMAIANPNLSTAKGGTLSLQNQSKVTVNGEGGGKIVIRGGQLVMDHSGFEAHTLGHQNGKGVDITVNESVIIKGDVPAIATPSFGAGKGGDVHITTPYLEITGSFIDTSSLGSGQGGHLEVHAQQMILKEGGTLASWTFDKGKGGNIIINVNESLTITGRRNGDINFHHVLLKQFMSLISAVNFGSQRAGDIVMTTPELIIEDGAISTDSIGIGEAGHIIIQAQKVTLRSGGFIASNVTHGLQGGTINLNVADTLTVSGHSPGVIFYPTGLVIKNQFSAIASTTFGTGQAGHILISARQILLLDKGCITVATVSTGNAGKIIIKTNDLKIYGHAEIVSSSGGFVGEQMMTGTGQGGNIEIQTHDLLITTHGIITAHSLGTGEAGKLKIQANTIQVTDQGHMTTSAKQATGGDIHIATTQQLYLHNGKLATSVMGGAGHGGNIIINNPTFVILDQGQIVAQADEGTGGNITIQTRQLITTPESLIDASSKKGISGNVIIASPENPLGDKILVLPSNSLNAMTKLKPSCGAKSLEELVQRSKFYVLHIEGSSLLPIDWQPSSLSFRSTSQKKLPTSSQ